MIFFIAALFTGASPNSRRIELTMTFIPDSSSRGWERAAVLVSTRGVAAPVLLLWGG
jgi:hypothetical protein